MKIFIYAVIAIVACAIIAGFFFIGSPAEQRLIRFDEQRVQNLQFIQGEVLNYWQSKGKLPEKLADLVDSIRGISVPQDPETNANYVYNVKGVQTFELCADFARPSQDMTNGIKAVPAPYGYTSENWAHKDGHICFGRSIDQDFYPVKTAPVR